MRTTTIWVVAAGVIFSYVKSSLAYLDTVNCLQGNRSGNTKDCEYALELIPYGPYFDPAQPGNIYRPDGKFDLHLDYSWRWRNRTMKTLPAAFRFGSCVIFVRLIGYPSGYGLPVLTASTMYFSAWPQVRRVVPKFFEECPIEPGPRNMGYMMTRVNLQSHQRIRYPKYAEFLILVRAVPENMGHGSKNFQGQSNVMYNVYESTEGT
jgi:hypothetical protein